MPFASLHKVSRSITKNMEIDDDISADINGFLWVQGFFTCRVTRLDLPRFLDDGYALFFHFRLHNVLKGSFFPK